MRKTLRAWVHDLYYGGLGQLGARLAMKCQAVIEAYDLGERPKVMLGHLRSRLHFFLCESCHNHKSWDQLVRRQMQSTTEPADELRLNKINQAVLEQWRRKRDL